MNLITKKIKNTVYHLKPLFNCNIYFGKKVTILSNEFSISKRSNFSIGNNSILSDGTIIRVRDNSNFIIGKNVGINNNTVITCRDKIVIGDNVLIGPNVMIFDHDHDYKSSKWHDNYVSDKIIIEDDVWIGCGAIILKGSHIKKGSVIAAGTVVRGVVENNNIFFENKTYNMKEYIRK